MKILMAAAILAASPALAQRTSEMVITSFAGPPAPAAPSGRLLRDGAGNLYGVTTGGGTLGYGTVYKRAPDGAVTVLHSFANTSIFGGPVDGAYAAGGLVRDAVGNLYGTTVYGGATLQGTLFQIAPDGTETILHSFGSVALDGLYPLGDLLAVGDTLYGVAATGGRGFNGNGTIFSYGPDGYRTLHSFNGGADGSDPTGGLITDGQGHFWGVEEGDLAHPNGGVYEFDIATKKVTVLYWFKGRQDGSYPIGLLTRDASGNLYGVTSGGDGAATTVFKLAPDGSEAPLHVFGEGDGIGPVGGLVLDPSGSLIGVTVQGGAYGAGRAFAIAPDGTEIVLHDFGAPGDGSQPSAPLVRTAPGTLTGPTGAGGADSFGTVYTLTRR